MNEEETGRIRKRRKNRFLVIVVRTARACSLFLGERLREDVIVLWRQARLFFGVTFLLLGLLSFQSGKYCDGNDSSYYACTRPSTYYYYPFWAILLTLIGTWLITLWFLRKQYS